MATGGPGIHLGANRYGKAGIRLATIARDGDTHHFTDLEIEVRLEGDFTAAHVDGDNSEVLPTDTMRGTCYALARQHGVASLATFGQLLTERFLVASPATSQVRVELVSFPWERIVVDDVPHPHGFRPAGGGSLVTVVSQARDAAPVLTAGVRGLRVLKTTGSAFSGFPRDGFTTLPETRDRIMATTVEARWGYGSLDVDHDGLASAVPTTVSSRFASHDDSESVQHTLWEMGNAVLEAHPDVTWIRFRLPNEHHVLADLSAYGLDNPNEVFVATDRPFGVIEAVVARDGSDPEPGW